MTSNRTRLCALALASALAFLPVSAGLAAKRDDGMPVLRVAGSPEIVLRAEDMACAGRVSGSKIDVIDMPANAYRRDDGTVVLMAGNKSNYYLSGPSLDDVRRSGCDSLLPSAKNADPKLYRDNEWLFDMHSEDGRKVIGFVHNEYHGEEHTKDCVVTSRRNRECWYAAATMVVSEDGGRTFQRPPAPDNVLLALPYEFDKGKLRAGVRAPKVVENPKDGQVYVFLSFMDRNRGIYAGQCLVRGSGGNLADWQMWNGKEFAPYARSPYAGHDKDCTHVLDGTIFSVKYLPQDGLFVALGATRNKVYYSFSEDLVHWGRRKKLMDITGKANFKDKKSMKAKAEPVDGTPTWYYSLLDPASGSRNFDTLTDRPYLYFVQYRTKDGKLINSRRDLMRVPLEVE